MPSSLWASPGSSGISKTYASSAWSWCFTIAYFPSPTGLAASPFLNSSDNSSLVSSCGFSNTPPTFAQYLSDLLASVVLISGNDFLPMTKSLYLGDSSFSVLLFAPSNCCCCSSSDGKRRRCHLFPVLLLLLLDYYHHQCHSVYCLHLSHSLFPFLLLALH